MLTLPDVVQDGPSTVVTDIKAPIPRLRLTIPPFGGQNPVREVSYEEYTRNTLDIGRLFEQGTGEKYTWSDPNIRREENRRVREAKRIIESPRASLSSRNQVSEPHVMSCLGLSHAS